MLCNYGKIIHVILIYHVFHNPSCLYSTLCLSYIYVIENVGRRPKSFSFCSHLPMNKVFSLLRQRSCSPLAARQRKVCCSSSVANSDAWNPTNDHTSFGFDTPARTPSMSWESLNFRRWQLCHRAGRCLASTTVIVCAPRNLRYSG